MSRVVDGILEPSRMETAMRWHVSDTHSSLINNLRTQRIDVHPCVYIHCRPVYTLYDSFIFAENTMVKTRVFKNGNSQAVRIPSEFQYERLDIEYEIERNGEMITIRPAQRPLNRLMDKFRAFSDDFMADGREQEIDDRRDAL